MITNLQIDKIDKNSYLPLRAILFACLQDPILPFKMERSDILGIVSVAKEA
jgi:hypothetical protein